jgi:hypothetical protein
MNLCNLTLDDLRELARNGHKEAKALLKRFRVRV